MLYYNIKYTRIWYIYIFTNTPNYTCSRQNHLDEINSRFNKLYRGWYLHVWKNYRQNKTNGSISSDLSNISLYKHTHTYIYIWEFIMGCIMFLRENIVISYFYDYYIRNTNLIILIFFDNINRFHNINIMYYIHNTYLSIHTYANS